MGDMKWMTKLRCGMHTVMGTSRFNHSDKLDGFLLFWHSCRATNITWRWQNQCKKIFEYPPHIHIILPSFSTSTLTLPSSISRLYGLSRHELQWKHGRKSNEHYKHYSCSHHHKYYKRELSVQSAWSSIILMRQYPSWISTVRKNNNNIFVFFIISYMNSNMNIRNITIMYPKYNEWY